MLMNKVQETKVRNQEAFRSLAGEVKGSCEVNFKDFTLNNKPVKGKSEQGVVTSVVQYGRKGEYGNVGKAVEKEVEGGDLISDDEMFMNQISSPEDFEVLSDSDI